MTTKTLYNGMQTNALLAAGVGILLLMNGDGYQFVEAHGFMQKPASRNFINYAAGKLGISDDSLETEYCPHCLSGGGVANMQQNLVNGKWTYPETFASSVRRGMCGDSATATNPKYNPYDQDRAKFNMGILVDDLGEDYSNTYASGQSIDIVIDVSTHHAGHFEFFLCDTSDLGNPDDLTQDCLNKHQLIRDPSKPSLTPIDSKYPGRFFLEPRCLHDADAPKDDNLQLGQRMTAHYMLPEGLTCEHCVLQFWWITSNSCLPPGYRDFFADSNNNVMEECNGDGGSKGLWNPQLGDCGDAIPEEFWNCADIKITRNGGNGGDGSTTTTTNRPTSTSTTTTTTTNTPTTTTTTTTTYTPTPNPPVENGNMKGKCCWWPQFADVNYDECVSFSMQDNWCAKGKDECTKCTGNWIDNPKFNDDNNNDNNNDDDNNDDDTEGVCCWWPATGQCTSKSPSNNWCAKSKDRCDHCGGRWM